MTVITESFDTANSATLGPNLTWAEVQGNTNIVSNQAETIAATSRNRAESDLATDNQECSVDVTALPAFAGSAVFIQYSAAANTAYFFRVLNTAGSFYGIFKIVAGTATQIGSSINTPPLPTPTYSQKIMGQRQANGSYLLTGFINGVAVMSVSDSALSGNRRAGFGGSGAAGIRFDNFRAADTNRIRRVITGMPD